MRRSIGLKVFTMLFIMGVTFFIAMVSNINALAVVRDNNDTLTTYLDIEQAKAKVSVAFQQMQLYANLAYFKRETDEADTMNEKLGISIESMSAALETLNDIHNKLGDEELHEAYVEWEYVLDEFSAYCEQILAEAEAGNYAVVETMVDPLKQYKTPAQDAEDAFNLVLEEKRDAIEAACALKISGTTRMDMNMVSAYLIMIVIVGVIVTITIARPARKSGETIQKIVNKLANNEGDLTERIPVKTRDEIGQMTNGINGFIEQLQSIMQKLKGTAEQMLLSAEKVRCEVNESNESAGSVSAAMEELAASMEEISATLDQLANGSNSVLEEIQEMANRVEDGVKLVAGIREHAKEMHQNTIKGKEATGCVIEEIRQAMLKAVEESRSVEQIKELTAEILNIASQTNLLALNASIEAARAGEAGRGFAVVADEIRGLADNSRDTANNIQSISNLVTGAMESLTKNTEDVVRFIDEKVMKDYDGFVAVVEQYEQDADSVNEMLTEFEKVSDDINGTIQYMNTGMNDIAIAVGESAKGITNAAQDTVKLAQALTLIQGETNNNQEISNQLSNEVNRFKRV